MSIYRIVSLVVELLKAELPGLLKSFQPILLVLYKSIQSLQMASSQSSSGGPAFFFFGTCPTVWEDLTPDQKDSCIAQIPLSRQIEGHYVWPAAGELARQWKSEGYEQYLNIIEIDRFNAHGSDFGRNRAVTHELRLLSTSPLRQTAVPFIIITSKNIKAAQETVDCLRKHPYLSEFGFGYLSRQEDLGPPASGPPPISIV